MLYKYARKKWQWGGKGEKRDDKKKFTHTSYTKQFFLLVFNMRIQKKKKSVFSWNHKI